MSPAKAATLTLIISCWALPLSHSLSTTAAGMEFIPGACRHVGKGVLWLCRQAQAATHQAGGSSTSSQQQTPLRYTKADILSVMPADLSRMSLVEASRSWRKGVRTYIIADQPVSEDVAVRPSPFLPPSAQALADFEADDRSSERLRVME